MTVDCNSDLEFQIWKFNLLLLLKFMDDFSPQEGIDILIKNLKRVQIKKENYVSFRKNIPTLRD